MKVYFDLIEKASSIHRLDITFYKIPKTDLSNDRIPNLDRDGKTIFRWAAHP